jgi:hypothetical protein
MLIVEEDAMKITLSLVVIIVSILAYLIPGLGFCLDIPKTPLDVEGTDGEYKEFLGLWKGSWDNSEHVILIYKVKDGKAYTMQSWTNANKSVERICETRQDDNLFIIKYTTSLGDYALTCKKGSTKMDGRHYSPKTKVGRTAVFHKVDLP